MWLVDEYLAPKECSTQLDLQAEGSVHKNIAARA